MAQFIGRQFELQQLRKIHQRQLATFIVIKGRRRIGKSRLVEEFAKDFTHFYRFEGLAPDIGISANDQLLEFSRQLARQLAAPFAPYLDWSDALWALGEKLKTGKLLLLFDEISWMGLHEKTFLSKIKSFWDQYLRQNDQLTFIICGSASAWIEQNILNSTGFVGRISYTLTLAELSLHDCKQFWPSNIAPYEKLKVLAITGGIPKYLEEINPKQSAEENIKQLCFTKGAMLVEEFKQIFSHLFLRDSLFYKKILSLLTTGAKEQSAIRQLLAVDTGGRLSAYLAELELAGFITRDYTWHIKSGRDAKLSHYRLSDNYLRFYLKYIDQHLTKIERNNFRFKHLTSLPEWYTVMGLQFENLVLNNRLLIHQALGLSSEQIISENPFYQKMTQQQRGCQIDYLIQTTFNTLYICEIKFSKQLVNSTVITAVQDKINALKCPKSYSFRPVLIHVNGVTADVIEQNYFAAIIDFSDYL